MEIALGRSRNGASIPIRRCDVCFRRQITPQREDADAAGRQLTKHLGYQRLEREQDSIFDETR